MSMHPVELYPLADEVSFTEDDMVVSLVDGRTVSAPLVWFPRLAAATSEHRRLICRNGCAAFEGRG